MLELNRLYNLDCMQGMKEFPDGFFDLAIVDPPYGIELKRQRGGRISEEQVRWINGLLKQGYAAAICKGWQEAADVIIDYLRRETEG